MPIVASGIIKLSNIRNEFNSTNTGIIKLSDYANNSLFGYTTGLGLPNKYSMISLSNFYNKSKSTVSVSSVTIASISIYNGATSTTSTGNTINVQTISTNIYYFRFFHQGNLNSQTNISYTDYTITLASNMTVDILLVGGGGGGGASVGSGGGGGGLIYMQNLVLNAGTYKFRIGAGGIGMQSVNDTTVINGANSILYDNSNNELLTALGGAVGNGQSTGPSASKSGGSGAGGITNATTGGTGTQTTNVVISANSRTYGFGTNGGAGASLSGGGGGGAGTIGTSATASVGGNGGNAKLITITGVNEYYAAGGGGSIWSGTVGLGGIGATGVYLGGNGTLNNATTSAGNALENTGSGGGGSAGDGTNPQKGGNGSSGMGIIKFTVTTTTAQLPTIISGTSSATLTNPSGNIYYYIFTQISGTNTITFPSSTVCEVLIVGGGGGGGGGFCGGGGAGGCIYYNNSYTFNAGTYTITIGSGGGGGISWMGYNYNGTAGGGGGTTNIIFNSSTILSAAGGGGGGPPYTSNGGNSSLTIVTSGTSVVTNYTGAAGKNDGRGNYSGGGGAGANQNAGLVNSSGQGGDGYQSSITQTATYYSGGGGGESYVQYCGDGLGNTSYGGGGRGGKPNNANGNGGQNGCVIIKFTYVPPPSFALPTTNLFARYSAEGPFTSTQWNDLVGTNHITTYRGAPYKTTFTKGTNGLTGTTTIDIIKGTFNDGLTLPFALTSASYTIAYIARYVGGAGDTYNRRILDANNYNYLWGFWNGINGDLFNSTGWVTNYSKSKMSDTNYWIIGVETEISARYNGYDWTLAAPPGRPGVNPILTINNGTYTSNNSESSNWEIAELIIYNTELSLDNKILVEKYLANKYSHFSFNNVVTTDILYKGLTNNTGVYDNWYNVWNSQYYIFINSTWYLSSELTPVAVAGNAVCNMNTLGSNGIGFSNNDDGYAAIPGFIFNWFGGTYNGNIYINTNNYLTFGNASTVYYGFSATNPGIPGIYFGATDRYLNWCNYDTFYTNLNGTQIGRLIFNTSNYSNRGVYLLLEILLIRNPTTAYQYIQFNCSYNNAGGGSWFLTNGGNYVSVTNFSIGDFTAAQSFIFRTDASGSTWEFLNQYRVIYSPI